MAINAKYLKREIYKRVVGFGKVTVCVHQGEKYDDVSEMLLAYQAAGLLSIGFEVQGGECPAIYATVSLTDEGRKYTDGDSPVRLWDLTMGAVTGIQLQPQFPVGEADYVVQPAKVTPFGSYLVTEPISAKAHFELFDDGWRIKPERLEWAPIRVRQASTTPALDAARRAVAASFSAAESQAATDDGVARNAPTTPSESGRAAAREARASASVAPVTCATADACRQAEAEALSGGHYQTLPGIWNRELDMGQTLSWRMCRVGAFSCKEGTLTYGASVITFTDVDGKKEFSASPQGVVSEGISKPKVMFSKFPNAVNLKLKVEGKDHTFNYMHSDPGCNKTRFFNCADSANSDQESVLTYLSDLIRSPRKPASPKSEDTAAANPAGAVAARAADIMTAVAKSAAGHFVSPLTERPIAEFFVSESDKTGVPLWLALAQAQRETSFGSPQNGTVQEGRTFKDGTKGNAHNLFNIRPGGSWTGRVLDLGPGSGEFRVYDSYQDSVRDYMRLMSSDVYRGLTLRDLVYKYFPPSDNGGATATDKYVETLIAFAARQGVTISQATVVVPIAR